MPLPIFSIIIFLSANVWAIPATAIPAASSDPTLQSEIQQTGSLESRIASLKAKIDRNPKDPDLHFELSKLYEEDVDKYYDEALAEFKTSIDMGLKNKHFEWTEPTKLLSAKGSNDLINEGEYDKAIISFEKIIALTPNNPNPYNGIGMAHWYKGEYDKAIDWLKKAIDLRPVGGHGKRFYNVMGFIHLDNETFESALLNFNKIGLIDPKYKGHYFGIGQVYQNLGEYDTAIDAYKAYLKHDKGDKETKELIKECKKLLKQSRRK